MFLRKSSEALDLLTEAKLERRFRLATRDLSSLYAGYYVAELLNELTDDSDPQPELFDAANDTLARLMTAGVRVGAVVLRFELTALRMVGHQPALDACAECGKESCGNGPCAIWRIGRRRVVRARVGLVRNKSSRLADRRSTP